MTDTTVPNVYNIPSGQAFSRAIVRKLLSEYKDAPDQLGRVILLLPTRRACRTVQETFLQETKGKPLLLPKIQPMGDVDEQDLSLALAGTDTLEKILALPPAISPLRRRILLAKTIHAIEGYASGFDQALALSDALASFLDQIMIEELEFSALSDIVSEEFADHWKITLDFLKILSEYWPKILAEEGVIDSADRRNRLMRILAGHWQSSRPQSHIIAAGSTGSIPATAELLRVIAHLPNGCVVLPGLDMGLDEDSGSSLGPTHPQYGLKHLLSVIGIERSGVLLWNDIPNPMPERAKLASELMRPAATSKEWITQYAQADQQQSLHGAFKGLSLIEAENQREEAAMIAIAFRRILEDKNRTATAALVTPDRKLARRVSSFCKRWDIEIDDSAGKSLKSAPLGTYLLLLCEAALSQASPASLLALLKHKFSCAGLKTGDLSRHLYDLEYHLLRGIKPAAGFDGLRRRFEERKNDPYHKPEPPAFILEFIDRLERLLGPFIESMNDKQPKPFMAFLTAHLEVAEALAGSDNTTGALRLWKEEEGEAAAQFFSELAEQANSFDDLDGATYMRILNHLLGDISVRPKYGTHPRLSILGQLEARLIDADLLILGGLNEGSWPPDPGHDPWMSRPMRAKFGLPDPDRSVGLAAHDFIQGFCNPHVLLTRSKRIDGTASVPARWLQRLDTVLNGAGLSLDVIRDRELERYYTELDDHKEVILLERPRPVPPLEVRPDRLSVTKIETLMKDPYSIYASHILRLSKLAPVEKPIEAMEKGNLIHDVMEKFIKAYPDTIPPNAKEILYGHARDHIETLQDNEGIWSFWWPRFERLADWFLDHEHTWRKENRARPIALEAKGVFTVQTEQSALTISGIADRIDLLGDGTCAIIDYKTSASFSAKKMATGDTPQLPLEALMLQGGAFADNNVAAGKKASILSYWSLTGGTEAGKVTTLPSTQQKDLNAILERAHNGLTALIDVFADPETPYICLPRSQAAPRFNDYEHLARISEWAALEDEELAGEMD